MFDRHTMGIMIATFIVAFAVAGLPQTTHLASAHFGDHTDAEHTFDNFEIQFVKWGATFTLSCTSFFAATPDHPWWAPPVKICFPPGPSEVALPNGCISITYCLGTAECTGTICPPDDDEDDDTSGNNDDTGGNS